MLHPCRLDHSDMLRRSDNIQWAPSMINVDEVTEVQVLRPVPAVRCEVMKAALLCSASSLTLSHSLACSLRADHLSNGGGGEPHVAEEMRSLPSG